MSDETVTEQAIIHAPERVPIGNLHLHPRNYRDHPPEQIEHLAGSIRENGQYRNIVCARDWTILGGHGVMMACQMVGLAEVNVVRLDIEPDSPQALRILAGDNEVAHMADSDDRALSELLKDLYTDDPIHGLLGTGYDEMMLTNLVFVTRPAEEIENIDTAAHWVGLPGWEGSEPGILLVIHFDGTEDRDKLLDILKIDTISHKLRETWSVWWPPRERNDLQNVRFVTDEDDPLDELYEEDEPYEEDTQSLLALVDESSDE